MNQHFLYELFTNSAMTKGEQDIVVSKFRKVSFDKKEFLLEIGKSANSYWFIESGFLRAFVIDTEGNEITTNFFTKNDIVIDWQSYFLKTPCNEYVQSLTDCTAWQIHFEDFMTLFHIENFREVGRTNLIQGFFKLKRHSLSLITEEAKNRYLNLMKNQAEIIQNVPAKHIATYLGITETSLSRIRKEIAYE